MGFELVVDGTEAEPEHAPTRVGLRQYLMGRQADSLTITQLL